VISASSSIGVSKFRHLLARAAQLDRVSVALGAVLLVSCGFYLWTVGTTEALSLHDGSGDRYNLLADAFLHLRLSIGPAPAALLHLADPYNPYANGSAIAGGTDAKSLNDDILYHGQLYFEWGPAPALVLLVPLHLLGFEPSASVTVFVYAIAGLAFALATLRAILTQIGGQVPIWACVLAGLALSLSSVVPFILRGPTITTDTLAGGYCFCMAGVWLASSALVTRSPSPTRLALMSLSFGLAANSRPTLALPALVMIPVYLTLRSSRSRAPLLASVALPFCVCIALLFAYNQARFNDPFEVGAHYQLAGYESRAAPLGRLSYMLPGAGFYSLTPPQPKILFPFVLLKAPQVATPAGLAVPEATGGLLPMAPVVILIVVLPWIWRRRPALLGALPGALLVLATAGLGIMLLSSYQFFASTERYEVDFATLFVLGGLAAWLSLSRGTPGRSPGIRRRLIRIGGAILVAWGCATGFAITFSHSGSAFAETHRGTWRDLEDVSTPVSVALAAVIGHPVIAEISAAHEGGTAASYESLGTPVTELSLSPEEHAELTVVSSGARAVSLVADVKLSPGTSYGVQVDGPGPTEQHSSQPDANGSIDVPVRLDVGLNRFTLHLIPMAGEHVAPGTQVMLISDLAVADRG
jgi:hypothetical protein